MITHTDIMVDESAILPWLTTDEIASIKYYFKYDDKWAGHAEAQYSTVCAIQREAKKYGMKVVRVSNSRRGNSKTIYVQAGDSLVRVSDHELPETLERLTDREHGRGESWDREEVILDWQHISIPDIMAKIKGEDE